MLVMSSFSKKQLEEMSSQNLAFLLNAYSTMLGKSHLVDFTKIQDLCRVGKRDKETKMKLVDIVFRWQFDYNGCPCNYNALRKIDSTSVPEYLETIAKQSLIQLLDYIPIENLAKLNQYNYRDIVVVELIKQQRYKNLQLYSSYLPRVNSKDDLSNWRTKVKILDNILKELIFSNEDYINYLVSTNMA